ncbi:MAG: peroxiredoxin family protein [Promethearchaeota archaeon]
MKHFKYLTKNMSEIEKRNVKLIAIAKDSIRRLKKMKDNNNFNFSIISDKGGNIAKSYNMFITEKTDGHDDLQVNNALPAKVLINKNGEIVWYYIGGKEDRPSIEILTEAIDKYL